MEKELCDNCTFNYACCLGDPTYHWEVDLDGILSQHIDHCNAFVESSESLEEND